MEYQICRRCVMDTTDVEIVFDENGICNHCKDAERSLKQIENKRKNFDMQKYIDDVKRNGKNKEFDCIIGLSGGVDSCYCIYLAKQYGLRPLAVHLDNGWNSELSVYNMQKLLEKLGVELYTYVVDWKEFRDLQLSFLKASTPDCEIPTDQMLLPLMGMVAHKYGVKTIWHGGNQTSESILPSTWSHGHRDWKYIKSIQKQFGTMHLKTYPYFNRLDLLYFTLKYDWFNVLDFIDYDKEKAKDLLIQEFNWQDYGGKHKESFYTKFYQDYILPVKFGYDKRRMHTASLVVAGQMTREDALEELRCPTYDSSTIEQDIAYFLQKMQISRVEFDNIMATTTKTFWDYPNYETDFIGKIDSKLRAFRRSIE